MAKAGGFLQSVLGAYAGVLHISSENRVRQYLYFLQTANRKDSLQIQKL